MFSHEFLMWTVFFLAAYSAIANDSIQTIGTFIASNKHRKWYYLWIYMGGILLFTHTYSWVYYDGDVSHGRLLSKGLNEAPESFSFLPISTNDSLESSLRYPIIFSSILSLYIPLLFLFC